MSNNEHNDVPEAAPSPAQLANILAPPDGGYGWICCLSMTLINGWTWGIIATYGVYLSYYINNEIFPGATALDYSFIGGVNFAAAMLCAPIVNIALRKFGTKPPMYVGCVFFAGGFVAASFATEFWHLALSQGLLVGLGVGCTWLPAAPILASWFSTKRSVAQGIASSGSGIAGVIFSVATTPMIENMSLAWALRITGIISFVVLVFAIILIKDRNASIRPRIRPLDTEILMRYKVLLLVGFSFFNTLGYIVLIYSLGAFATSLGLSQTQGGIVITVLNVGTALLRPCVGVLSDRYGRITVACILTMVNFVMSFAVWIPTNSYGLLLFFALIVGGTSGAYWGVIAPLCAEVVDLKELPSTLGLMWLTVSMPALFSEAIALELRRPNSSHPYLYVQIYTGLTYVIATMFLVELRRVKLGFKARERHR